MEQAKIVMLETLIREFDIIEKVKSLAREYKFDFRNINFVSSNYSTGIRGGYYSSTKFYYYLDFVENVIRYFEISSLKIEDQIMELSFRIDKDNPLTFNLNFNFRADEVTEHLAELFDKEIYNFEKD